MADITGALIGGGITAVITGGSVIYSYGKLSQEVRNLAASVDRLTGQQEKANDILGDIRERVAKLEGASQPRAEPQH